MMMVSSAATAEAETLLKILSSPQKYKEVIQELVDRHKAATESEASNRSTLEALSDLQAAHTKIKEAFEADKKSFEDYVAKTQAHLKEKADKLAADIAAHFKAKEAHDAKVAALKQIIG